MYLDWRRKREHLQETCKLHTRWEEMGIEPSTLEVLFEESKNPSGL